MSPDELNAATDVAERFLDNIETVVHGKREQIKLVVAALMVGGAQGDLRGRMRRSLCALCRRRLKNSDCLFVVAQANETCKSRARRAQW